MKKERKVLESVEVKEGLNQEEMEKLDEALNLMEEAGLPEEDIHRLLQKVVAGSGKAIKLLSVRMKEGLHPVVIPDIDKMPDSLLGGFNAIMKAHALAYIEPKLSFEDENEYYEKHDTLMKIKNMIEFQGYEVVELTISEDDLDEIKSALDDYMFKIKHVKTTTNMVLGEDNALVKKLNDVFARTMNNSAYGDFIRDNTLYKAEDLEELLEKLSEEDEDECEEETLYCRNCGISGTWESVTDSNGNLFYCEECHEYVCSHCLETEGLMDDDNIICPSCLDS